MKRFPLVFLVTAIVIVLSLPSAAQQQAQQPLAPQQAQAPLAPQQAQAPSPSQPSPSKSSASQPAQLGPQDTADTNGPLFGLPPLPKGQVSLIGGTVQKVDRLRNRVKVKTFGDGGKTMSMGFDERTHIYRDGVETTERGIRQGDRVYVDTMLDGPRLFARNIRVVTSLKPSDARGQIEAYEPRNGRMTVRDDISGTAVNFHVAQDTAVKGGEGQGAVQLVPGALVTVRFAPDKSHGAIAREISILAVPGNTFTFSGKVRHLDMRSGMIAVENLTDNKTYELSFEPGAVKNDVTVGSDVTVSALFIGRGYKAQTVSTSQARE
jgi:hypothetical protein